MAQGRKFVFFLGAGASLGAGAYASVEAGGRLPIPTQGNFWATFLRFCYSHHNRNTIESFLFRYFLGYRKTPGRLSVKKRRALLADVDVEEVFTFLSERVRAPSTSSQLRTYANEIWDCLVTEIGPVFSKFPANRSSRQIYRQIFSHHIKSKDAVVSFNYDTIFEDSLSKGALWAYEGLEDRTKKLPILKPHGSINWQAGKQLKKVTKPDRSVIVAPTHLKFVAAEGAQNDSASSGYLDQSPQIQEIWRSMEEQMKAASTFVFIGYSFPAADLYFSSILRSVLATRPSPPGIVLVNPDSVELGKRIQSRFYVPKIVRFFDMQQFADSNRQNLLRHLRAA